MTTSQSPEWRLRAQANEIARRLKRQIYDVDPVKVGVVQDDKIITLTMSRESIVSMSEVALAEMIFTHMRGETPQ